MSRSKSRRHFLKVASAAAAGSMTAVSYAKVRGANERIGIAMIGCGSRGFGAHMKGVQKHAQAENVEFRAVVDPWRIRRERAAAATKQWHGRAAESFVSYRDVVDRKDIDAIMIASCDHQHTTHLEAAARCGKDVYCEKPLAMDFDRLKDACGAVEEAGVVFQAGTQVRSWPTSAGCREAFKAGTLGKFSRVEQCRNAARPYWYSYLQPAEASDVDWKEFLMDRPAEPFRADRFTGWYGYRDFSDGPVPGLASHFIDLVNYIVGSQCPKSVVCHGGTFVWKDRHEFTCPDQVEATWVYPEGFVANYSTNFGSGEGNRFEFYSDRAVMRLNPWNRPTVSAAGEDEQPIEPIERPDHFLDWLQSLRTRRECNAPIAAGYQHAVAVIMAMRAFDTGRRQNYDPAKREIYPG